MNLNNIENSIKSLEDNVGLLKGKVSLLEEQYSEANDAITNLKIKSEVNIKAIEVLDLIQKSTKELICNIFENIVSNALMYIHQSNDYIFTLDFDRHGNTPKLSFRLKTPDMKEAHDIVSTRAGGIKDAIALALRFVLLEVSKNKGLLFLDEPFKRLDNEDTTKKAIDFVKETQRDTNRQIFIITHKDEVINSVPNPIIIKEIISNKIEPIILNKKRGRPKKEKKNV